MTTVFISSPSLLYLRQPSKDGSYQFIFLRKENGVVGRLVPWVGFEPSTSQSSAMWRRVLVPIVDEGRAEERTLFAAFVSCLSSTLLFLKVDKTQREVARGEWGETLHPSFADASGNDFSRRRVRREGQQFNCANSICFVSYFHVTWLFDHHQHHHHHNHH